MASFLYGQTEYNLLKNSIHLDDYVKKASEYGYKALSITDSNLYAHYKFYNLCKNYKIKPIIGLEINLSLYNKIILAYALDNNGYKNLCRLSTRLMKNIDISYEDLSKYAEGLFFVTTGNITFEEYSDLKKYLNNLFIGISYSPYMKDLYDMAQKNKIISLPLSLCLYLIKEDYIVYEALTKIGGNQTLIGDNYFKSPSELEADFLGMESLFKNLDNLISKINIDLSKNKIELPHYPLKNGKSSKEYLKSLCYAGLNKRLQSFNGDKKPYYDRLDYELGVINKMGYDDYFLIVWDFIKYAKNNKILVGPGRGSAAGSLVSYSIGISSVDPLKYNLFFERFLNPERISMPDIDTDFPDNKRDMVIEYVKNLYGEEHVCSITAFGTFKIKSSIRDLGRVLKLDEQKINDISNQIKEIIENSDSDTISNLNSLYEKIDDEEIKKFIYIASKMEGIPRHISTHAAGIILSEDNLSDIIPLQYGNNMYQSQLEAPDCEAIGLLKMDFLGIKNLCIIDNVINKIDKFNNINIFNQIDLKDKKTFDMLSKGDTIGIFQLEKKGMTRTIVNLKPERFEDIVAILALYRPGPMDNIDEFIQRRHGKKFSYIHNDLKPILEETYGIIVYQEQIMQIAQKFAGYSLGEADVLRRAVSKKKESILISEKDRFIKSSIDRGYTEDIASKIYDDIVKFANYGFNKSHSVVYALFSYTMAYLKANYKELFITNMLSNVIGSIQDTKEYITYAISNGIKVLPPDINKSNIYYVNDKGVIYMPFNSIKGLGIGNATEIINERNNGIFKSFDDFKERCKISKSSIEALIYSGAFDSFGKTKKSMISNSGDDIDIVNLFLTDKIESTEEFDESFLEKMENNYLGLNIKYSIAKKIDLLAKKYKTKSLENLIKSKEGKSLFVFSEYKIVKTKNGEDMLLADVYDGITSISAVMFPSEFKSVSFRILRGKIYAALGNIRNDERRGGVQFVLNKLAEIK